MITEYIIFDLTKTFMLLLKKQTNYALKFPITISKVNCFATAYDDTLVVSAVVRPGKSQAILHIDKQGEVINHWDYNYQIGCFGMLGDKNVIVLNIGGSTIDIINLQSNTITNINHRFTQDDIDCIEIVTFYETKYFCIVETQTEQSLLSLTYYGSEKGKVFPIKEEEFEAVGMLGCGEVMTSKANNHSKIVWLLSTQDKVIQLRTYDLKEGAKQFTIRNTLQKSIFVHNIYETKAGIFTLICSNRQTSGDMITSTLIVDTHCELVRQSTHLFYQPSKLLYDNIVHSFFLGSHLLFFISHNQLNSRQAPLFYVNNQSENIDAKDQWQNSCYVNFFVPSSDDSTLLMGKYDNGDVFNVEVTAMRMCEMKEIALHFMLNLNEDFADDLLQDAIELLSLE